MFTTTNLERSWRRRVAGEHDAPDAIHCVRIRMEPDECADLSFLDDEEVNTPEQRAEELERADRDGCWGAIAEYWDEAEQEWLQCDSIWGFIGDDFNGSGYDDDLRQCALAERARSVRAWRTMCKAAP